ncbi:MAG: glycosyltransferase [Lachnospiraceae bacterium]|nr:glycosyltransferase [Lachnospiraceae bacterium]
MNQYSVLMAVYINDEPEYFRAAVESMLNQTLRPSQIVIVCDGELKDTHNSIISHFEKDNEGLFTIVRIKENFGVWNALNKGLKFCKNELIARMDSDDISVRKRCEIQMLKFQQNPALDYIGSYAKEFVCSTENVASVRKVPLTNHEIKRYAKRRNPFNNPTVMYKKSKVIACGGYRKMKRCEDYDLAVRLIMRGAVCENIPESLLYYRLTDDTFQRRKNWNNTKGFIYVRFLNWRRGFSSFWDFLLLSLLQVILCFMPTCATKWFYQKILRKQG